MARYPINARPNTEGLKAGVDRAYGAEGHRVESAYALLAVVTYAGVTKTAGSTSPSRAIARVKAILFR